MIGARLASGVSPLWALTNAIVRPIFSKRAWRAPCPVVSVGNVLAGGVGKTEIVNYAARYFLAKGYRVAVLMRGYGAQIAQPMLYTDFSKALQGGAPDEALVHMVRAPGVAVICSPNRAAALRQFYDRVRPQVVLLDDGLQHFAIQRDLDIIVHDFSIKPPIYRDFPALFERAKYSQLQAGQNAVPKTELVCMGDVPPPAKWSHLPWRRAQYKVHSVCPVAELSQSVSAPMQALPPRALLVSAIGNPSRFEKLIKKMGTEVVSTLTFNDHAPYNEKQLQQIHQWASKAAHKGLPILTTLKDGVKLVPKMKQLDCEVNVVLINLEFVPDAQKFDDMLLRSMKRATL